MPCILNFQGHPTTVSSEIHWKLFLGYSEYFYIPKMHSKERYKICVCLAILGGLEHFRNYKLRFQSVIFPKILDVI